MVSTTTDTFTHEFSWDKPEIGKVIIRGDRKEEEWKITSILSREWISWSQLVEEKHPDLDFFREFSPATKGLWRCQVQGSFVSYTENRLLNVVDYTPTRLTIEIPEGFVEHGEKRLIPPGRYWLRHDTTQSVTITPTMVGIDWGHFPQGVTIESIHARSVYGSFSRDYKIQCFFENWSDGKTSDLGGQIVSIVPEGGYPRQEFEEDDDFNPEETLEERRLSALSKATNPLIEGLICSGGSYNSLPLEPIDWQNVPGTFLYKTEHPQFGTIYRRSVGNYQVLYGNQEAIVACWEKYSEQKYWIEGVYKGESPGPISPEESCTWLQKYGPYEWLSQKPDPDSVEARGCVGHEFHSWNALRGGYSPPVSQ